MRYHQLYSFIILIILLSGCSSYKILEIERRIKLTEEEAAVLDFDSNKNKSVSEKHTGQSFHYYITERYLTGLGNPDPAGIILKKGADYALKKNYSEAEFLFNEAAKITSDGTAENNLAVVFEASGKYNDAFRMYLNSLLISPENEKFRSNFHYFLNQNYKEENEPVKTKRR